ncbi:hypothetical protein GUJ93_ZPchr0003g18143 [Zizania palustris]|uniref:Uncharacterized protein n=1 Tax=Zizania palustris TaxID=103762 RepID=A0A8J5SWR3_ZIZPA|nr:hypothetical protein GUJ93_ZPchr0003g18143 [Zizania palustris]
MPRRAPEPPLVDMRLRHALAPAARQALASQATRPRSASVACQGLATPEPCPCLCVVPGHRVAPAPHAPPHAYTRRLMDRLQTIPTKQSLELRAEVASMASDLKSQRYGLEERINKISEYGVRV